MLKNEKLFESVRPVGEDTVAAIMWTEPVVLPPRCRVNEAIERIR